MFDIDADIRRSIRIWSGGRRHGLRLDPERKRRLAVSSPIPGGLLDLDRLVPMRCERSEVACEGLGVGKAETGICIVAGGRHV